MAKGTVILLIVLVFGAAFLFGLNTGKKIERSTTTANNTIQLEPSVITPTVAIVGTLPPFPSYVPTPNITSAAFPTISPTPIAIDPETGLSTYSSLQCGFSFSYPGSYKRQTTGSEQSFLATNPTNNKEAIAAVCATSIPRPPVDKTQIEATSLGGISATLYHDKNQDGSPRDDVIVKHPQKNMEIILVGYGSVFQQMVTSFKFQ